MDNQLEKKLTWLGRNNLFDPLVDKHMAIIALEYARQNKHREDMPLQRIDNISVCPGSRGVLVGGVTVSGLEYDGGAWNSTSDM